MRYKRKGRGTARKRHTDRKKREYYLEHGIIIRRIGIAAKHIEREHQAGKPITLSMVIKKASQNRVPYERLLIELKRRGIPIIGE